MSAHSSMAIANEFLRLQGGEAALTHTQLQKLCYFAHGWNLAINGEPLIAEDIEAWDNGPVFRDLWEHLKNRGRSIISDPITPDDVDPFAPWMKEKRAPYKANLSESEKQIIEHVWKRYGRYGAFRLSDMTHQPGTPWSKAYAKGRNSQIDNVDVTQHYIDLSKAARAA